jgi:ABC-type multidrug transport system fused ATPase/permease subunit
VIFTLKGAATYGHTVILSKISNAILANNQRRLFAKLMSESVAFFSERHSSEFLARLTAGANSVTAGAQPADQRDRTRSAAR